MQKIILLAAALCVYVNANAQTEQPQHIEDSLYIQEVEEPYPAKILHAEPLYIDLIRDLGARKGEHEWNFGGGITDNLNYDTYQALVEYEFAPLNRLGEEFEVPFTFYAPLGITAREQTPMHRVESLKMAAQYTFLVAPRINTSMALGYINELVMADLKYFHRDGFVTSNVFNPFLIAAKRFGQNFHALVYTGPHLEKDIHSHHWHNSYATNTSFHYMISGTRNFIGVELNKEWRQKDFDMTIRPQLRVAIADNLLIGIIAGVPVRREHERFSSFLRLIWEPGIRHHS